MRRVVGCWRGASARASAQACRRICRLRVRLGARVVGRDFWCGGRRSCRCAALALLFSSRRVLSVVALSRAVCVASVGGRCACVFLVVRRAACRGLCCLGCGRVGRVCRVACLLRLSRVVACWPALRVRVPAPGGEVWDLAGCIAGWCIWQQQAVKIRKQCLLVVSGSGPGRCALY